MLLFGGQNLFKLNPALLMCSNSNEFIELLRLPTATDDFELKNALQGYFGDDILVKNFKEKFPLLFTIDNEMYGNADLARNGIRLKNTWRKSHHPTCEKIHF
jgi:hypothetical protein